MNKHTDIYSVEYYISRMGNTGEKQSITPKQDKKTDFKILVQDHVKDSIYLVDA